MLELRFARHLIIVGYKIDQAIAQIGLHDRDVVGVRHPVLGLFKPSRLNRLNPHSEGRCGGSPQKGCAGDIGAGQGEGLPPQMFRELYFRPLLFRDRREMLC